MTTFVLVIAMYGMASTGVHQSQSVAMTTVVGFATNAACVQQAMAIRKRPHVRDAFCVAVR